MRHDRLPLGLQMSVPLRHEAYADDRDVVQQQAVDLDGRNFAGRKADDEKTAAFLERSQRVGKAATPDRINDDLDASKVLDGTAKAIDQNILVRTGCDRSR